MTAQARTVVLGTWFICSWAVDAAAGILSEQSGYHREFLPIGMTRSPANAEDLHRQLERVESSTVISWRGAGGLVVRHLHSHHYPQQRPGRIVPLGTPHQGNFASCITAAWAGSSANAGKRPAPGQAPT